MNRVKLGVTNLDVSPIAFGTWQLGGDWGKFDEQAAIEAIQHARELGINFFDTAQAYGFGVSERLLGDALRDDLDDNRDELVIATKGGLRMDAEDGLVRDSSPEWLRRGVDESLNNLGLDHIDLYQVHWPDPQTPFEVTAHTLEELVGEGKIGHVGVSNFNAKQTAEFSRTRPVETSQPPYHLFRREIEHELLPYAHEHDIGVLVYGPLAHGLLTGAMDEHTSFPDDDWRRTSDVFEGDAFKRNLGVVAELERFAGAHGCSVGQLAIAWTLANPAVHVAIVGSRKAKHIEDSVGALNVELSAEDLTEVERIMAGSVPVAGPTPEGS
ncbi:MAG TPA: aldo/keto reductase [Solirubrobacteraceae bacterium]|nr:aldo/keto reductase [Solirubrobacteraceae bacterium]